MKKFSVMSANNDLENQSDWWVARCKPLCDLIAEQLPVGTIFKVGFSFKIVCDVPSDKATDAFYPVCVKDYLIGSDKNHLFEPHGIGCLINRRDNSVLTIIEESDFIRGKLRKDFDTQVRNLPILKRYH